MGCAGSAAGQLVDGLKDGLTSSSLVAEFVTYFKTDITNKAGELDGAGYQLWVATEAGILRGMEEGTYVQRWVEYLLPALMAALGQQGTWTGEGEP